MKNPKKLTRNQKQKLSRKHLDPDDYVVIKEDNFTYTVQLKSKIGTEENKITFDK